MIHTTVEGALRQTLRDYQEYLDYTANVGVKPFHNDLVGAFINKLKKNLVSCSFQGRPLDSLLLTNTFSNNTIQLVIQDNQVEKLVFSYPYAASAFQKTLIDELNLLLESGAAPLTNAETTKLGFQLDQIINQVKHFSHVR